MQHKRCKNPSARARYAWGFHGGGGGVVEIAYVAVSVSFSHVYGNRTPCRLT